MDLICEDAERGSICSDAVTDSPCGAREQSLYSKHEVLQKDSIIGTLT